MINRRSFVQLFTTACIAVAIGCGKFTKVVNKVIAALPTAAGIAKSIVTVLAAFYPELGALAPVVTSGVAAITDGFTTLQNLLQQYQSNLGALPADTITKADDAIGVIQSNLDKIEALVNSVDPGILNSAVKGAVALAVGGIQAILLALTPYLTKAPAAVQARMQNAKSVASHVAPYRFVSAKDTAQHHNAGMVALGFPTATVPVP